MSYECSMVDPFDCYWYLAVSAWLNGAKYGFTTRLPEDYTAKDVELAWDAAWEAFRKVKP